MVRDEQEYHQQLAKELGSVLQQRGKAKNASSIMKDGPSSKGILGLDEVWCLWNRVRGVGKLP